MQLNMTAEYECGTPDLQKFTWQETTYFTSAGAGFCIFSENW